MRAAIGAVCVALIGCAAGPPAPVAVRIGEDACAHCRMTIVAKETAAQIVSAGAEPVMFDEIGCLQNYLAGTPLAADATVFVADHRTGEWTTARDAVFTKTSMPTPMSSGLVAHADAASRDADPSARGGTSIPAGDVLDPQTRSARP